MRHLIFTGLISLLVVFPVVMAAEIAPELEAQLQQMDDEAFITVMIEMADQFDTPALDRDLKQRRATRQQRHYEVVTALQDWANRTQADVLNWLDQQELQGKVQNVQSMWISNLIFADMQKAVVYQLAAFDEIATLHPNYEMELIEPVRTENSRETGSLRRVESGLEAIRADEVWAMGINGEGTLVSNVDSGVDGNHPALADRWLGLERPWQECWYNAQDPNGSQFPIAVDGAHGTHTMGTETGLGVATGDTIGVAWGAQWIAAGVEFSGGSTQRLVNSLQWIANPDGDPTNDDDVPDVCNNSWGSSTPCRTVYDGVIQNCEANGCAIVFSAGNSGPGPQTIGSPASSILTPYTVFAVGAVNGHGSNPPYPIASFSSRGPSGCDGQTIKPEVSAPGVEVRSSVPGGGYQSSGWSGTSMAAPHVSGTMALMRQVDPNIEVDVMKDILMSTAIDHGSPGEDNDYGWGVIDAYAAVMEVFARLSAFEGTVTDAESGEELRETHVYIEDTAFETVSDVNGFYHLSAQPGEYFISAERFGYYDFVSEISYTIASQETIIVDIEMDARPTGTLYGMVTDTQGNPLENAGFSPVGVPVDPFYTDGNGEYAVELPGDYEYTLFVYAPDHDPQEITVEIPAGSEVELNVEMVFVQSFEESDGGFTLSGSGNEWEWGAPTEEGGPAFAYSGDYVWGTDLDGVYGSNRRYNLITPTYHIGIDSTAKLVFYTWYELSEGWDGGNVAITTNAGEDWTIIDPVGGYPDDSIVGLGGARGFTGDSDGWERVEFPLADYLNQDVQFRFRFGSTNDPQRGWFIDNFALYGSTDFGIDVPSTQTQIQTPLYYELHPNYPNPFNPFTLIHYQIPRSDWVSLRIYNSEGRLIRTLVEGEQPAGAYSVEWDGKRADRRPVPSGIYYYRLDAGEFSQTRSMVLLK
ncbi:MAG: T9SS C-terminal target domain-containing protein [Gemmatimonadetes bacterium]|nr:MAG: T9SS C-terminal target domain-containing protein [Gemmatimonadota bacterium]